MACAQITTDPTLSGNVCNNPADKCLFTNNNAAIRDLSGKCATGSLETPARVSCIQYVSNPTAPEAIQCYKDCVKPAMMMAFGVSLSDPCLICPDNVVTCGAKFCLSQCLANPMSPTCTTCLCQQHPDALGPGKSGSCLVDVFQQCAGFTVVPADVGCPAM